MIANQAASREKPVKRQAVFTRARDGYMPALDGWRAIAIMGVILVHSSLFTPNQIYAWRLQRIGANGVQLFFAISGILICSRLLDEERSKGHIGLKKFFVRRIFRIQPAALVFLFALAALGAARILPFDRHGWLLSFVAARNF